MNRLYTVAEAMPLLGMGSRSSFDRYRRAGLIPVRKVGRSVKVSSDAIERIQREGLPTLDRTGELVGS